MKVAALLVIALAANSSGSAFGASPVLNGNFETGDFSGWSMFVTPNGTLSPVPQLPDVTSFDVTGGGFSSLAATFQVGEAVYFSGDPHTFQGGGIFQNFESVEGLYSISLNIASYYSGITGIANRSPGVFTLFLDGATLDSRDLYQVNGGRDIQAHQTIRSSLSATVPLQSGTHEIRVLITRDATAGGLFGETPLGYLDNVQVSTVPEPTATALLSVGLLCLCLIRPKK